MRLWLTSALLCIGAIAAYCWFAPANWFLIGIAIALAACAIGVHVKHFAVELAVRGAMWSIVTISVFATQMYAADAFTLHNHAPMATALACCAALLAAGGIRTQSTKFQPVAYQRILTIGLVLAVADIVAFTMLAVVGFHDGAEHVGPFGAGVAAAAAIGVVGLYHLRTWGLLLSVAVNLFVVFIAVSDGLHLKEFRIVFLIPACVQLLLYVPWFISAAGKRAIVVPAWAAALGRSLPAASVVVMMMLALQPLTGRPVFELVFRWLSR